MKIIKNKIKLVIWDLDETFWFGTLSEENIIPIDYNIELVKKLTDRGIVNSISSKNNFSKAQAKLIELNVWDYFVFPQISWNPKGQIIKDLIENMNLRADNVLFIDDNTLNLNEALYFSPNLNVCLPENIENLLDSDFFTGKDDKIHSRLSQYKNLEKKIEEFAESNMSNIEFLEGSNIQVEINKDVLNEIDRIHELIDRTNQLNYTKNRVTKDELIVQLKQPNIDFGYLRVTDKYGDYGISGFYLLDNNNLKHFLFSCRTMNMYIESWLYQKLGCPIIEIEGDVAVKLDSKLDVSFINDKIHKKEDIEVNQTEVTGNSKILMMGGCDLDQTVVYLNYKNLFTEFNYPNKLNINVHKDHTHLIRQFSNIKEEFIDVINKLAVLDISDVKLKINSEEWDVLIFSPLNDYSRGVYRHIQTGFLLPFDAFNINWTDRSNWETLPDHLKSLPLSFLKFLKEDFEFIGPISPEDFYNNLQWLIDSYPKKKFIFLNGSEVEYESKNYWESNMYKRHIEMNRILERIKEMNSAVEIIDVKKFVKNENDVTDNIRHYNKKVYKEISDEIIIMSKSWIQGGLKSKGNLRRNIDKFKSKVINKINSL